MQQNFPVLQTSRIRLVQINEEHLHDLFLLFNNEAVTRYYNIIPLQEPQEAQKLIDWFASRLKESKGIRWGIVQNNSHRLIGTIGFNNYTPNHRANLGYDLHPEHWRKGIMSEALETVVQYGFEVLQINRIEAEVMTGNIASQRMLDKIGFQNEGLLRDWMFWNDHHYDMFMYALLRKKLRKE